MELNFILKNTHNHSEIQKNDYYYYYYSEVTRAEGGGGGVGTAVDEPRPVML